MKFNQRITDLKKHNRQGVFPGKIKKVVDFYELDLKNTGLEQQVVDPFNFNTQSTQSFFPNSR